MRFDDMVDLNRRREEKIPLVTVSYQRYERRRLWIGIAIASLLLSVFGLLLWQVVTASTEIGTPSTESESVVRANERLLEMVKWTITTLLVAGGALVGLNWYTSEARYNLDRAIAEQERINYRIELESAMNIAIGMMEDEVAELRDTVWALEHPGEEPQMYIHNYETGETTPAEEYFGSPPDHHHVDEDDGEG